MPRTVLLGFLFLSPGLLAGAEPPSETVSVRGRIVDADTGALLPARIYVQGQDGKWYFPKSASDKGSAVPYRKQRGASPSVEMHVTLSAHPFVVDLPPGKYELTVERGHEYHPLKKTITVDKKPVKVTLEMKRWINVAKRGWYSGDTHVHRTLKELPNVMLAEDLNVALPLTYWVTEAYNSPRTSAKSSPKDVPAKLITIDKTHVISPRNTEYEIFTVKGKRHTLGAIFVLNHQSVFEQGAPPVGPIAKKARAEKALLDLDKHNWPWSMMLIPVMKVDLYELANNHVWRAQFGFPGFGTMPPQYMGVETDRRGMTEWGWIDFTFQNYYALLNCGFRLRPTAGTASGVHPVPLGFGRVYVKCSGGFSYKKWIQGLDRGQSFVTTGPMLFVQVNDKPIGQVFQPREKKGKYRITGEAISGHPLDRIELVVNGKIRKTLKPANTKTKQGGYRSTIRTELDLTSSSWIIARCFESRKDKRIRFAHTGPVHVEIKDKPLLPRPEEIKYLIEHVKTELKRHEKVLPEAALQEYRQALAIYETIAKKVSSK